MKIKFSLQGVVFCLFLMIPSYATERFQNPVYSSTMLKGKSIGVLNVKIAGDTTSYSDDFTGNTESYETIDSLLNYAMEASIQTTNKMIFSVLEPHDSLDFKDHFFDDMDTESNYGFEDFEIRIPQKYQGVDFILLFEDLEFKFSRVPAFSTNQYLQSTSPHYGCHTKFVLYDVKQNQTVVYGATSASFDLWGPPGEGTAITLLKKVIMKSLFGYGIVKKANKTIKKGRGRR